ncbi:hypothetical protein HYPSUDRAFT_122179, partial [Hypholoma sublateritium FD-334 SS-4]
ETWEVSQQPPESPPLPNPHPPQQLINGPSRTSSFNSISPPHPSPQPQARSHSPVSNVSAPTNKLIRHHDRDRDAHARKKAQPSAPVAMGILRALDPPRSVDSHAPLMTRSEERFTTSDTPRESLDRKDKERRGFWGTKERAKDKPEQLQPRTQAVQRDRERDPAHDRERAERGREARKDDDQAELTRMIGYLTATASEDWSLVLEVCDRASASDTNAKEAVRAIRREFKYGEPPAQLSAARLWAIMLRNCSDTFISQSRQRKFLDTLEELLNSPKTSPVVRERLLEVVAAASFASGTNQDPRHDRDGFRGLWKRVKPFDKPDEGVPFDTEDAMFHPPASAGMRTSGYEVPVVSYQEPSPVPAKKRKSPTRNRIIPPDEDMRRLFQECKIGQGNASLLSQALALSKPEELRKKDMIIKEFVIKCRSSQELIYAQIPWASAGAERSRAAQDGNGHVRPNDGNLGVSDGGDSPTELTIEEQLLAALLGANAELMEALQQYEDMERVAMERKAEDRSRKELRRELRQIAIEQSISFGGGSSSRSPSPPPQPRRSRSRSPHHTAIAYRHQHSNSHSHSLHSHQPSEPEIDHGALGGSLAPPPAAPHGPRSPAQLSLHSRTPSPTPRIEPYVYGNNNGSVNGHWGEYTDDRGVSEVRAEEEEVEEFTPIKPSAKALGKMKAVEPEPPASGHESAAFDPDDIYYDKDPTFVLDGATDPDIEDDADARWRRPPQQFVYDAVVERSRQLQGDGWAPLTNGTH